MLNSPKSNGREERPEPNCSINPSLPASHLSPLSHLSLSPYHFSLFSRDDPAARQIPKSVFTLSPLHELSDPFRHLRPGFRIPCVISGLGSSILSGSSHSLTQRRISLSPLPSRSLIRLGPKLPWCCASPTI